ncbi:ATP-dependent endonuclease [Patescibacteria group bacterium]
MKITKVKIDKFRNLENIELSFSKNLNAIAGQNGTSKTSLLGLIGHMFTSPNKTKTLLGRQFATQFSEVFRFAYPDYDKPGSHIWSLEFEDGSIKQAISHDRIEKGKKNSLRIRVGKSSRGSGKIHLPVIYLGMSRLYPLASEEESDVKSDISILTKEEAEEFGILHNEILLMDEKINSELIKCKSKEFHAPTTENYNHLGNSAGQDNLGQIITALISFKRLRKELGDKYKGGILLIDEIDASLYPAAQMKLIEKLYEKSLELNLQIFFTTHSLEVLEEVKKKRDSIILFLDKTHGPIFPKSDLDPRELSQKLLVLGPDALKEIFSKKYLYCEDVEAADFIKNILPKEMLSRVEIFPTKLGENFLKEIAKKKIPDFKKSLIVLDGDSKKSEIKNVLFLPGKHGPDKLIFDLLKSLDKADGFWKRKSGYDKQYCFRDFSTTSDSKNRKKMKDWYISQKRYWGRSSIYAWKLWIDRNKDEIDSFIKQVKDKI